MGIFDGLFGGGPKSADDYFNRGVGHLEKGEFDKAIVAFTEAIRLDPELPNAYYNRAGAYQETGEIEKAVSSCPEMSEVSWIVSDWLSPRL